MKEEVMSENYEFESFPEEPIPHVKEIGDNALLIFNKPDYVTLPAEMGGGRCNVLKMVPLYFPNYGVCTHYKLDKLIDGKRLWVAKADQFYWHLRSDQNCLSCGSEALEFKDSVSEKEFGISGLCQQCQDEVFKE